MRYLLDTHALIWFLQGEQQRFSKQVIAQLLDEHNSLYFSAVSVWEMAIKFGLHKSDFPYDPQIILAELRHIGFQEIKVSSHHTLGLEKLPTIHQDPFDRLLICQAECENLLLLTADQKILQYPKSFILNLR